MVWTLDDDLVLKIQNTGAGVWIRVRTVMVSDDEMAGPRSGSINGNTALLGPRLGIRTPGPFPTLDIAFSLGPTG